MPQTKLLYPYEYTSQIRLIPRDPHDADDDTRSFKWATVEDESDEDVTTFDLSHEDLPWERIRFEVEASLPDEELEKLVPVGGDATEELRMYVGIASPLTRLREAVELVRDGALWRSHVVIRRSQVSGTVQLTPFLVRATDLPDGTVGPDGIMVASGHAMRVGEGRRLALMVDPPNRSLKGFVKTVWEDFSQSQDPMRRANDTLPFDLDLDGEEPILILNSLQLGMRAALYSRKRTGGAAVMRHTLNAAIAQSVWMQLYLASVASLDYSEDTGEVGLPAQNWKRRVLDGLIDQLSSTLPRDQRLKSIVQLRDSQMQTLAPTLSRAAQRTIRMGRLIREAERAAERFTDVQEVTP
jgi:hypothetical protein